MAFQPQNDLERSLMRAVADPAWRPQFYRDFAVSDVLVMNQGPAKGKTRLEAGDTLLLAPVERDGKRLVPIFSSLPRLRAMFGPGAAYVTINALDVLRTTRGASLVLNPGSDYGKEFVPPEVEAILDGSIWRPAERWVAEKETEVMIGEAANPPHELMEALKRLFATRGDVSRAWAAHFMTPGRDEKPHTLIALEVSGPWDEIAGEVGIVAQNTDFPDPPLDLLPFAEDAGGISEHFKSATPFYVRAQPGSPS